MTLTPEQHRRAVEVMAEGALPIWYSESLAQNRPDLQPKLVCDLDRKVMQAALTALLTVADVTWKENGDG